VIAIKKELERCRVVVEKKDFQVYLERSFRQKVLLIKKQEQNVLFQKTGGSLGF
jgi:hypothetical protein